jgi:hypothetical protein
MLIGYVRVSKSDGTQTLAPQWGTMLYVPMVQIGFQASTVHGFQPMRRAGGDQRFLLVLAAGMVRAPIAPSHLEPTSKLSPMRSMLRSPKSREFRRARCRRCGRRVDRSPLYLP